MKRLILITTVLLLAGPAAAHSIHLRHSVRLPHGHDVIKLHHIAHLKGEMAERLGDVEVGRIDHDRGVTEIHVRDVRKRLDEEGVHWGKVHLTGSQTIVRGRVDSGADVPMAMTGIAVGGAPVDTQPAATSRTQAPVDTAAMSQAPTLGGELVRLMLEQLEVDAGKLRVVFPNGDETTLNTSNASYRFEIEPMSRWESDRLEFSVRAWQNDRPVERWVLRVDAEVQKDVLLATRSIRRGEPLIESDLRSERRWVTPRQAAQSVPLREATGLITAQRLEVGELVSRLSVQKPVVVRRGDKLMVRCRVGGLVLALKGEARADGANGEQIEVRKLGERKSFLATVVGPGEVVVDLKK